MKVPSSRPVAIALAIGLAQSDAIAQCGTTIYDTGGAGGNYGALQNLTWTYCAPPGQVLTITFTAFNTEAGFDELSIHNGPTNASPMLGIFSGTALPPAFTSTTGGCLTLWFTSDLTINAAGWVANITCTTPPPPPAGDCVYQLQMFDSFGDGWDGSTVGISINGGPFTPYTITGAYGSVLIGLYIGQVLVVQYTALGPWQNEISYSLSFFGGAGVFNSGTPPATGIVFTQTIDCNPPPAPPEDCVGAITICSGQSFNNNTQNTGNVDDLTAANYGCLLAAEQQGTWYTWSPSTGGQVGFTIDPLGPDDYDWAVWGPYPTGSNTSTMCPPAGAPIRCSFASGLNTFLATGDYDTGMGSPIYSPPQWANPTPPYSETAAGDGWVTGLNVIAGQVYLMYISNFDQTGLAFDLSWTLAGGASLDCTVLPMELISFSGYAGEAHIELEWITASEQAVDRFMVQRSMNGTVYDAIGEVQAQGSSLQGARYTFIDPAPMHGPNYYRLIQVDADGSEKGSSPIAVMFAPSGVYVGDPFPVPAGAELTIDLFSERARQLRTRLMDATGKTVVETTLMVDGSIRLPINVGDLPAGFYEIEVVCGATGAPLRTMRWLKQ